MLTWYHIPHFNESIMTFGVDYPWEIQISFFFFFLNYCISKARGCSIFFTNLQMLKLRAFKVWIWRGKGVWGPLRREWKNKWKRRGKEGKTEKKQVARNFRMGSQRRKSLLTHQVQVVVLFRIQKRFFFA